MARATAWIRAVVELGNWNFRDPEGVIQDVLLKLVRLVGSDRFEHRSSFKTFVYSVAKYTCVDRYRHQGRRPEAELDDLAAEPSAGSTRQTEAERRDLLRYILQRLPPHCSRLWRFLYVDGLTAAEIGARVGRSPGAVRVRVHRCLKTARRVVAHLESEGWEL